MHSKQEIWPGCLRTRRPLSCFASPDPALLGAIEPLLQAAGARVEVVLSADAALASIAGANLPAWCCLTQACRHADRPVARRCPRPGRWPSFPHCFLIAGTVTEEGIDLPDPGRRRRLDSALGGIGLLQLRLDLVMRNQRMAGELETLRAAAIRSAQFDRLTGVYNRETLLAMLFRETDRVQRMNSFLVPGAIRYRRLRPLELAPWRGRLRGDPLPGSQPHRFLFLRSYDLLGRPGMDEFLIGLPACSPPAP